MYETILQLLKVLQYNKLKQRCC